eukprot:CAMPEP_0174822222 /NCGR_PEP_ID=MMETSP1107-20130205/14408_1 /TAXON_ID=36770 /ORGANISM="Paraphysomonas vestita, Strain GFlagA" /LENGTH=839 /DNA_ID=CAMNT_0016040611 /DNA_START=23 /DNA_END=2542 /DNA_ORIENTATION=-
MLLGVSSIDVDKLLKSMSIEEKIGQLNQITINEFLSSPGQVDYNKIEEWISKYHIGSILDSPFSGGPVNGVSGWTAQEWREVINNIQTIAAKYNKAIPIIYGIDSIHGATYVYGATLFPQQIGQAATFNPELVYEAGKITSKDTRAAGFPWAFSPVLGLALHPAWARFYETYGEDPYLASVMGANLIKGLQENQEDGGIPSKLAACMKHYIGYSFPENGHDRAPVQLADRVLQQLYIPAFQAAVDAGVLSAMEGYHEIGGIPVASSKTYLQDLIRDEMGFKGMLVTDYREILNLYEFHRVAPSSIDAVELSLSETSIDMSMVPQDTSFYENTLQLVNEGKISVSRIDESAKRVLELKNTLGLFDNPIPPKDDPLVSTVGQTSDWDLSLNTARESITLLKNKDSVLPFPDQDANSIFVTGPTCDSIVRQTGGWSLHWQGGKTDSEFTQGVTVKTGLQNIYGESQVVYQAGPSINSNSLEEDGVDIDAAIAAADAAQLTVICVGEDTYTEKPGDIDDINLPNGQVEYVQTLASSTTTPIVLVIISGRPRLLNGIASVSSAVLEAYLPGPMGGQAIAEVISGAVSPSGLIPFNYPKSSANIPYPYHHKVNSQCSYGICDVEWEFGTGLSYSTFEMSDLKISTTSVKPTDKISISAVVKNTGAIESKYTALLFVVDMYRRITPEYKLLKRFTKVNLAAGESKELSWELDATEDLKYIGIDGKYTLESGEFRIALGADTDCRTSETSPLCASFTLEATDSSSKKSNNNNDDENTFTTTEISLVGVIAGLVGILLGMIVMKSYTYFTDPSKNNPLYEKMVAKSRSEGAFASTGYAPMQTRTEGDA